MRCAPLVNYIDVKNYQSLVNNNDWSSAFQKAVDDLDNNGVLHIPFGTYNASNVKIRRKSIKIIGNNSTIIQNTNNAVFDIVGGFENIQKVSSTKTTEYKYVSDTNNVILTNKIGVENGTAYLEGDIIKIFSEDEIDFAFQPQTTQYKKRKGEFAEVLKVEGNEVYLKKPLRDQYSSKVRLAKLMNYTCQIEGLEFDVISESEHSDINWNAKMIKIVSCKDVILKNLKSIKGYEAFVLLTSVYGYKMDGIHPKNLRNEPQLERYGYGINDAGSENGIISNCTFTNCRHGFTTSTLLSDIGENTPEKYGATYNTLISDCIGINCSGSSFDVHEEATKIRFINCESHNDYPGQIGSGYGFQVRSHDILISNCIVSGSYGGFYIFKQYEGTTYNVTIQNCKTYDVETSLQIKSADNMTLKDVSIIDGYFHSTGKVGNVVTNAEVIVDRAYFETQGYQGLMLNNAMLTLKDVTLKAISSYSSYRLIDLIKTSLLKMKNITIYLKDTKVSDGKLFRISDVSSSISASNMGIICGDKLVAGVFDSRGNGTGKLKAINIEADSDLLIFYPSNFESSQVVWTTPNKSSGLIQTILSSDGIQFQLNGARDKIIYTELVANTKRTLGSFPSGNERGQLLILTNLSANPIVIKAGTINNNNLKQDVELLENSSYSFIWNGLIWSSIN